MSLKHHLDLCSELTAQGWHCDEFQFDGVWTLLIERNDRSIVARDCDRQEVWQQAYQIATAQRAEREKLTRPTLLNATVHGLPISMDS